MDFWDLVKDEIKQQKVTQEWVATKSNISFETFRGWITKKRLPRVEDAVAIAKTLNTSVEYLLTGKDRSLFPSRIRKICRDLQRLSEDDLTEIEALIAAKLQRLGTKERLA